MHVNGQQFGHVLRKVVPSLFTRFSTRKGYFVYGDVYPALDALRKARTYDAPGSRTIVGIISNSDPRVRRILHTSGINVSNVEVAARPPDEKLQHDHIQFLALSYDVGYEKPAPEIFKAAEELAKNLLPEDERHLPMEKIYFGDDIAKDGLGAVNAGWESYIVDRDSILEGKTQGLEKVHRISSLWPLPISLPADSLPS
jgi:FMN phosphatase YigB (HAD superfamily)